MKVSDGLKFGIGLAIASFILERIFDILWRMGGMNSKVNALIRKTRPNLSKKQNEVQNFNRIQILDIRALDISGALSF